MKIDPSQYDYVMYVDASGDDGFKFEKDSSVCYCAAALLVKQQDISHNLSILQEIKKIVGCKPTDEVKYSKIRRHRRGAEALALLRNIKGKMSCYTIFKKELAEEEIPKDGSKALSVVCHTMALRSMDYFGFSTGEKVLISIDRMKHTEEEPLEQQLTDGVLADQNHPERDFTYNVVFRDSKDANFLLIQIADLLCGSVREHFEQYEANEDMLYFRARCPSCKKVFLLKKSTTRGLCKNGSRRANAILQSKNLHNVLPLFPPMTELTAFNYFFMSPVKMMDQHFYLFCRKI